MGSWLRDYREAIGILPVDAVDICLPTQFHEEAVMFAASRGKHVFCEKPIAGRIEQADAMIEACKKAGVKLQIGFCRRYDNRWLKWKELVQSGAIGRPVVWRHVLASAGAYRSWFFRAEAGGGPFLDGAIHNYDFGRLVFGEPESVVACLRTMVPERSHPEPAAPDTGVACIRFESGDELQLMWSWRLPRPLMGKGVNDLLGPGGALEIYPEELAPEGLDARGLGFLLLRRPDDEAANHVPYPQNDMIYDELADFVSCITEGREPLVGGLDGRRALEMALAVLEAGRSGGLVRFGAGRKGGSRLCPLS